MAEFDRAGHFFLYPSANALVSPTSADFLQVLKTVTFYNFQAELVAGNRTIIFETVDGDGVSSITTTTLQVLDDICESSQTLDVVFVLDSSSSLGLTHWNAVKNFTAGIVQLLPLSTSSIQFVFDLRCVNFSCPTEWRS